MDFPKLVITSEASFIWWSGYFSETANSSQSISSESSSSDLFEMHSLNFWLEWTNYSYRLLILFYFRLCYNLRLDFLLLTEVPMASSKRLDWMRSLLDSSRWRHDLAKLRSWTGWSLELTFGDSIYSLLIWFWPSILSLCSLILKHD